MEFENYICQLVQTTNLILKQEDPFLVKDMTDLDRWIA